LNYFNINNNAAKGKALFKGVTLEFYAEKD